MQSGRAGLVGCIDEVVDRDPAGRFVERTETRLVVARKKEAAAPAQRGAVNAPGVSRLLASWTNIHVVSCRAPIGGERGRAAHELSVN